MILNCMAEICKRADREQAPALSSVYPIDDYRLGLVDADGVRSCGPGSATFVVTTRAQDRDFDIVEPRGLDFGNWIKAGAPWFLFHQQHPWPIGTSINPETGQVDLWVSDDRVKAVCHFDTDDPVGCFASKKVAKGLLWGVSIAFVPKDAERIRDEYKAQTTWTDKPHGGGFWFKSAEVTEISLVSVPSNSEALLEGAPAGLDRVAKGFAYTPGGKCVQRQAHRRWVAQREGTDAQYGFALDYLRDAKRTLNAITPKARLARRVDLFCDQVARLVGGYS
jgi:hypothetical protein